MMMIAHRLAHFFFVCGFFFVVCLFACWFYVWRPFENSHSFITNDVPSANVQNTHRLSSLGPESDDPPASSPVDSFKRRQSTILPSISVHSGNISKTNTLARSLTRPLAFNNRQNIVINQRSVGFPSSILNFINLFTIYIFN